MARIGHSNRLFLALALLLVIVAVWLANHNLAVSEAQGGTVDRQAVLPDPVSDTVDPLPVVLVAERDGGYPVTTLAQAANLNLIAMWSRWVPTWTSTSTDGGATWSGPTLIGQESTHSPRLTRTADGKLWSVFHRYQYGPNLWYRTSADNGLTWSRAAMLYGNPGNSTDPDIGQSADRRLWLVWQSNQSGNSDIWYKTSDDAGVSWSQAVPLTSDTNSDSHPTTAQAGNGAVWVIWVRNGVLWHRSTSNGGLSWSAEAQIDGVCCHDTPTLAVTGDNVLWLATSWEDDIWVRSSTDNGLTWSAAKKFTRFVGPDSYQDLAPLDGNRMGIVWGSSRSGSDAVWFGILGEREDINPPPWVSWIQHLPDLNPDSDDTITFRAEAKDETGVSSVHVIWTLDGVTQPELLMYDDGQHGDNNPNDGVYGVLHAPLPADSEVTYRARATDTNGNTYVSYERSFVILVPFAQTSDTLLVVDSNGGSTDWYLTYYTSALDNLGVSYDVWDSWLRNRPAGAILNGYDDGIIIWAVPSYGFLHNGSASDLRSYLDLGGKLFITGQDVAAYLGWSDPAFLTDYLHAAYVQGNTGLYVLDGVEGDPIGNGLTLGISGSGGANNQYSTDEIDPVGGAITVFRYDSSAAMPLEAPKTPEAVQPGGPNRDDGATTGQAPTAQGTVLVAGDSSLEQARSPGVTETGTAGLRVDTGTYRVVFFSFGFEAINSALHREQVLERTLAWLREAPPRPTLISPPNGSSVPSRNITFRWSEVTGASSYQVQIDTIDTFTSPNLIDVTTAGTSHIAAPSIGTWYWRVRTSPGGAWTTSWQIHVREGVVQITSGNQYDSWPALVTAADGRLVSVWERSGELWTASSADEGAIWSSASRLSECCRVRPALYRTNDNKIWLVFVQNNNLWYRTSNDNGLTWSGESQITTRAEWDTSPDLTQTADGRIWVVWEGDGGSGLWYTTSSNGGTTWSAETSLPIESGWNTHPTIAQAPNGTIWVVWFRSYSLAYTTSANGGLTWTPWAALDPVDIINPRLRRASDGKLWLAYDVAIWEAGMWRSDQYFITSADSGATWSAAQRFTTFKGHDTEPALAALSDGWVASAWRSDRNGSFNIWYGIYGQLGDDNPPPYVSQTEYLPGPNPLNTDDITLRGWVQDETGIADVEVVWTLNGAPQADLQMYDDGMHGDDLPGDGIYGALRAPLPVGSQLAFRVRAQDIDGNLFLSSEQPFHVVAPFVKTANILLVLDSGPSSDPSPVLTYYAQAFSDGSWAYDVWNVYDRSAPASTVLEGYVGGAVVWVVPSWDACLHFWYTYCNRSTTIAALQGYLDNGGHLFITGQNVGETLNGEAFLQDYLHASFVQWNTGVSVLDGVAGDPIGAGLVLSISGSGGANNQSYPDEVDPVSPAVTVLTYDDSVNIPVSPVPELAPMRPVAATPTPSPSGVAGMPSFDQTLLRSSAEGVISSGTAGLRVAAGNYRVVYFAFGFEGINTAADRRVVMERVMTWLDCSQIFGDFDCDGHVSITDLVMVAQAWGQQSTRFDVTGDGEVTIADIMRVAAAWEG